MDLQATLAASNADVTALRQQVEQLKEELDSVFSQNQNQIARSAIYRDGLGRAIEVIDTRASEIARLKEELVSANREKSENAYRVQTLEAEAITAEEERRRRVQEAKQREASMFHRVTMEIEAGNAYRSDYLDASRKLAAVTEEARTDTERLHAQLAKAKKRARELEKIIVEPQGVRASKRKAAKQLQVHSDQ